MTTPLLPPVSRPKILLMGDSLTQLAFEGWGATLANVYQRRADVLNRGCSGYNTTWYLRLPMESFSNVCLVTLFFGANDAALKEFDAHHHVSVEDYTVNLQRIIDKVRDTYNCGDNILMITAPPVYHPKRFAFQIKKYGKKATGKLERTLENTGRYAQACRSVAATNKLPCLDLYADMQAAADATGNWGRFLNDGLHFSPEGHELVGKAVLQKINASFPHLAVEADARTDQWANSASLCSGLAADGPYHDDIDYKDPSKALP